MDRTKTGTMLSAIGGEIVERRAGYARGVLPLSQIVMQPTKVFHAGAIVTLADEVASVAIHGGWVVDDSESEKNFPFSVQLSVNLLANDAVGPLTAEAKVVRKGRMTVVQTEVRTSQGEVAALMTSTHLLVDVKKSAAPKASMG